MVRHETPSRALLAWARRQLRDPVFRRRVLRPAFTAAVALTGLASLTLGPAGIALLWRERAEQRQVAAAAVTNYLGTPVRDGPVTFVVHQLRCGSDDELRFGRRCEVTLGVRNDGPREVTVPAAAQRLRMAEGARHQAVNLDEELLGEVRPGGTATAVLVFDLPRHATVTHVEVHADTYSRGAPVDVAGQSLPLLD